MRYVSGKVGGNESLEYAKNILNKINEVESFEIFNDERTPYYEDFGIEKYYYNFIVRDIEKNEVWFDTNCGYRGSKPSITEQILQLLGAREDYGVYREKKINEKSVRLVHDANIMVILYDKVKNIKKKLMLVKIKPNTAKDRYNSLIALKNIGSISAYEEKKGEYEKEFKNTYNDKSFGENKVNVVLALSNELIGIDIESMEKVIKTIIYKNIGRAMEIEIRRL
ncbi:MAG: hypothetical protein ACRC28_11890 [Clostridium sp.]|uniref:hypothetical protein n=1 Tax=Clostridium sp. TaxID=1506 RepID=UPI003F401825